LNIHKWDAKNNSNLISIKAVDNANEVKIKTKNDISINSRVLKKDNAQDIFNCQKNRRNYYEEYLNFIFDKSNIKNSKTNKFHSKSPINHHAFTKNLSSKIHSPLGNSLINKKDSLFLIVNNYLKLKSPVSQQRSDQNPDLSAQKIEMNKRNNHSFILPTLQKSLNRFQNNKNNKYSRFSGTQLIQSPLVLEVKNQPNMKFLFPISQINVSKKKEYKNTKESPQKRNISPFGKIKKIPHIRFCMFPSENKSFHAYLGKD